MRIRSKVILIDLVNFNVSWDPMRQTLKTLSRSYGPPPLRDQLDARSIRPANMVCRALLGHVGLLLLIVQQSTPASEVDILWVPARIMHQEACAGLVYPFRKDVPMSLKAIQLPPLQDKGGHHGSVEVEKGTYPRLVSFHTSTKRDYHYQVFNIQLSALRSCFSSLPALFLQNSSAFTLRPESAA